jgi:hypothetical protein
MQASWVVLLCCALMHCVSRLSAADACTRVVAAENILVLCSRLESMQAESNYHPPLPSYDSCVAVD